MLDDALAEFRVARVERGISQQRVAVAIGRSDAWVSWTETGGNGSLSVVDLFAMLACVDREGALRVHPGGGGLRDEGQARVLTQFHSLIAPTWAWRTEVGMPIPGDLRAWDVVIRDLACTIGVDAETRLRDLQALDRRVMLKQRDSGVHRAIILVPSTRTNRDALRSAGPDALANYPIPSPVALRALRDGRDPGGNAVIVLPRPRPSRG
ncbi:MAG: helix-turn-helix transcriptional regulator [Chloroflexota bacterium]